MIIENVIDLDQVDWENEKYDVAFFASGYESRSKFIASLARKDCSKNIVVFAFKGNENVEKAKNIEKHFTSSISKNVIRIDGEDDKGIYATLNSLKLTGSIRILVDYSSMPRMWYNGIINWCRFNPSLESATINFFYSFGDYQGEFKPQAIENILALPGCEGSILQFGKTVAILGLGFDNIATLSAVDRLEPDLVYSYYAGPGANRGDGEKACIANQNLISSYSKLNLELPIQSVSTTIGYLRDLISIERGRANILLIPLGPKPHILAALLLCRLYESEITCLRISGPRGEQVDAIPNSKWVGTQVVFSKSKVEEKDAPPGR